MSVTERLFLFRSFGKNKPAAKASTQPERKDPYSAIDSQLWKESAAHAQVIYLTLSGKLKSPQTPLSDLDRIAIIHALTQTLALKTIDDDTSITHSQKAAKTASIDIAAQSLLLADVNAHLYPRDTIPYEWENPDLQKYLDQVHRAAQTLARIGLDRQNYNDHEIRQNVATAFAMVTFTREH